MVSSGSRAPDTCFSQREMMTMGMTLTPRALLRLFPNASKSTLAANGFGGKPQDYAPGVCDAERESKPVRPLDGGARGEETSPQRAHLRITRFGQRLLDDDNLRGGAKPLIDCLKEAGLLHDDSPEWLTLDVKQERVPAGMERTEVEITWL
jgi:hypothetical protein